MSGLLGIVNYLILKCLQTSREQDSKETENVELEEIAEK